MYDENPATKTERRSLTEQDEKRVVRWRRKAWRSEGRHGGPYGLFSVQPASARIAVIFSTASGSSADFFCGRGNLGGGAAEEDDGGGADEEDGGGGGGFLRERNTIFFR